MNMIGVEKNPLAPLDAASFSSHFDNINTSTTNYDINHNGPVSNTNTVADNLASSLTKFLEVNAVAPVFPMNITTTALNTSSMNSMLTPVDSLSSANSDSSLNIVKETSSPTSPSSGSKLPNRRPRATPEQLAILIEAYNLTPNPNMAMKKELAAKCNMTERSIQIWFQNRRARHKPGKRRDSVGSLLDRRGSSFGVGSPYGSPASQLNRASIRRISTAPTLFTPETNLSAQLLKIGSWSRFSQSSDDLLLAGNSMEKCFYWTFEDSGNRFRIQVAFDSIVSGVSKLIDDVTVEVTLELAHVPSFSMMIAGQAQWNACSDFSENCQASHVSSHSFRGPRMLIQTELASLFRQETLLAKKFTFDHPYLTTSLSPFTNNSFTTTSNPLSMYERRNSMPLVFNHRQSTTTPSLMIHDQVFCSLNQQPPRRASFVVDHHNQLGRSASMASLGLTNLSVSSSPADSVSPGTGFLSASNEIPFILSAHPTSTDDASVPSTLLQTEPLINNAFGEYQTQASFHDWMKLSQHQTHQLSERNPIEHLNPDVLNLLM